MGHAASTPPKEEYFQYRNLGPTFFGLIVGGAVALIVCLVSYFMGYTEQLLYSWLFAFSVFFTLSVGSLFWVILHHAVDAEWSVVVRRILENGAASFYYLWVFFIPIGLGVGVLYTWWNINPATDPVLAAKTWYLTHGAWITRACIYFPFFFVVTYLLRRYSTRQDKTGDPVYTLWSRRLARIAVLPFGVFLTLGAIDWLMALDYTWYSTMWGVYIFAGSAWSSMALLILVVYTLQTRGYLKGVVTVEHYHIMGKLLLAFTIFWAYIAFSQYFLIWYANIPEETSYFLRRNIESWNYMSTFLTIGHFVLPFIFLLFQAAKRDPKILSKIAMWIIFMQVVDMYIIVLPMLHDKGVHVHWLDLACLVAIGAPLAFFYLQNLGKYPLFPVKDPRLTASLKLTN